ncbi:enhancer of mRNA decapping [Rhizoclosmatium sp. JEL0117]|nr:enhancer of mRNA decapping [Rhizoclosmatium sp. JEL0117]
MQPMVSSSSKKARNPQTQPTHSTSSKPAKNPQQPISKQKRPNQSKYDTTGLPNSKVPIVTEPTADLSKDFDFQSSLDRFDKNKIFAEIRAQEEASGVSEAGGGQGGFLGKDRIGVREMVLQESGGETGNDAEAEEDDDEFDSDDFFDDDETHYEDLLSTLGSSVGPSYTPSRRVAGRKRPVFKSVGGAPVYGITPDEMNEVERICVQETGPDESQMIENAGRSAATLVIQALGGARRIKVGNHNAAPTVVVMAGNNKIGAYGLCTARHLANHEVNVVVCLVGGETDLSNAVSQQRKIFLPTGGQVVKHVHELPQVVDIIVDALLGSVQQILHLAEVDRVLTTELIEWSNEERANVLCLDIPSGINGFTGVPSSKLFVSPKWTLAFGLPKACLVNVMDKGELLLADIGIPKIVFQKLSVAIASGGRGKQPIRYVPPFGDKYIVGLTIPQ